MAMLGRRALIGCGMLTLVVFLVSALAAGCAKKPAEPEVPATAERILRFALANTPNLDPAVGSDEASATAHLNVYDTLVFPKPDGSVAPHVATRWEASPDGLTYTFYLRQGVRFHNGDELSAEDVVFSMERLLTIGQGWAYLFKGRVKQVEAVDQYTVRFYLERPFGPFVSTLVRLYIVNKDQVMANVQKPGAYGENGDYGTQWLLTHDAGSGPYMVKEMKQGEYLLAEAFKEYWGGFDANSPTSFKLIGTTEPVTIRTLMARRELELSDSYQPMEALKVLDEIEGVDIGSWPSGTMLDLMLNNKKPPTDDVHFRKALAYAVDYETLTTQIFPGNRKPTGLVSSTLPGYHELVPQLSYDISKAQEELKKSKYYGQLDKFPVEIAWVAEVPDREKVALLIQASAAKIGIKVKVVRVPWVSLVERAGRPDTCPNASIISYLPDYAEAGSILETRWHSRGKGTWLQMDWAQAPDLDRMIDDALATVDRTERLSKYVDIQKKLGETLPSVPLVEGMMRIAYQPAYVYWPAAEAAKAGQPVTPLMGYTHYVRDFKVYPEKMPK